MFYPDLKNTDLVAFIGKDGISILSKALEKVFVESHYNASDLVKSLHLKTRCLMAWLENISKKETLMVQIPLTQQVSSTFFRDMTLSFTSKGALIRKRETSLYGLGKTIEDIKVIEDMSLPSIASHLMNLEQYQDDLDDNEFVNSADLNKMIQVLVDKHQEFLKKSVKLVLNKSEVHATCEDCGDSISFTDTSPKLCVCYKFFGNNSIHIAKNDKGGLTLHFGKKWDQENITLFSRALKAKLK